MNVYNCQNNQINVDGVDYQPDRVVVLIVASTLREAVVAFEAMYPDRCLKSVWVECEDVVFPNWKSISDAAFTPMVPSSTHFR